MCALGEIGAHMAQREYEVTAFDLTKEMIVEGILSIQAGESPALIERKLQAYVLDSHMKREE